MNLESIHDIAIAFLQVPFYLWKEKKVETPPQMGDPSLTIVVWYDVPTWTFEDGQFHQQVASARVRRDSWGEMEWNLISRSKERSLHMHGRDPRRPSPRTELNPAAVPWCMPTPHAAFFSSFTKVTRSFPVHSRNTEHDDVATKCLHTKTSKARWRRSYKESQLSQPLRSIPEQQKHQY